MSPAHLTARWVQHRVAVFYGIPSDLMRSPRHTKRLARPRQVAMWLCAKLLPDHSLPMLGKAFGRDHSTIWHGIRRIEELRATDIAILDVTDTLLSALAAEINPPPAAEMAVSVGQVLLDAFQTAMNALIRRDPQRAMDLFAGWHREAMAELKGGAA